MRILIRSIEGFLKSHVVRMVIERVARTPSIRQRCVPDHAEFVICDHTIDITYIRLKASWMYLVAILDWFSRYVVSWALDQTLSISFVLEAVEHAFSQAKPEILNSDQGSQFTSPQYIDRLLAADIQISMDGRGRALDNIFTERLWRSVKYEEVYLKDYETPREARFGLTRYFNFYNYERPHQPLDYLTPAEVYSMKQNSLQFIPFGKEVYTLS